MKSKQFYLLIGSGIILILIILIYFSTFVWLFERYIACDTYYSHSFLVPFITAFLIWRKRGQLKNIELKYNFWGLILICVALLIHTLSMAAEVFFISGFSILILIFGISLFLFGKRLTRAILFPLIFLIFMFPLPLQALNYISSSLQFFVTKATVFIFVKTIKLPLSKDGFEIFLPYGSLIIENVCSGLRSLIVMLALGSIFAYFLKSSFLKRLFLFLCIIPVTLFSNIIRVVLLSFAAYIHGPKIITRGVFHDFTGYLMFAITFCGMLFLSNLLQCKKSL
jgi:exosortase